MSALQCPSAAEPPVTSSPPSGGELGRLAARVASQDPAQLDGNALVDYLQDCYRLAAAAEGQKLTAAARLAEDSTHSDHGPGGSAFDCAASQVSLALVLTPRGADRIVDLGLDLQQRLPETLQRLRAGQLDPARARILAEETSTLDQETVTTVEIRALAIAPRLTPGQLRARLRRMVIEADPRAAQQRHQEKVADRGVHVADEGDATAALTGFGLPADKALGVRAHTDRAKSAARSARGELRRYPPPTQLHCAVVVCLVAHPRANRSRATAPIRADSYQYLDAWARQLRRIETPETGQSARSLDQIRADLFCDLLTGTVPDIPASVNSESELIPTPAPAFSPIGRLHLTVPLATLTGQSDQPGQAAGFGPLLADITRTLAERALTPGSRHCWTVLDNHGHPVAHGTATYQPAPRLRAEVTARTPECAFPTCSYPATACDLDHTIPYNPDDPAAQHGGGPTCPCNLTPLCKRHHRLKHHPDWHTHQPPHQPHQLTWTTPTGTHHRDPPNQPLPFAPLVPLAPLAPP